MKAITYIGPASDGVEIAATGQVVPQGGTVEVDDALADALCEQVDAWQPASKPKAPKAATPEEG